MFCQKCGAQISDDSVFCENCGARVEAQAAPAAPAPAPAPVQPVREVSVKPQKNKEGGKKKLGLIIALAAVGAVVLGIVIWVITMFPLKVTADSPDKLVTVTGGFDKLSVTVKANQPILSVKYAVEPETDNTDLFMDAAGFGLGKKSFTIKDLNGLLPGDNGLKIYVKTLFGGDYAELNLVSDLGYTSAPDKAALVETQEGSQLVSNELIVTFDEDASESEINDLIAEYNGEIVGRIYYLGEYQIKFENSGRSYIDGVKSRLEDESIVDTVYYNMYYEDDRMLIPNDPEFDDWDVQSPDGNNWGLEAIDAPGAWEYNDRIGTAKVGVIDTWLQYDHEDINVPLRHTFTLPTDDFHDMSDINAYFEEHDDTHVCPSGYCMYCAMRDHGTHCAGIIGANGNNSKGVSGVFWNAELYLNTWWYLYGDSKGNVECSSTESGMLYNITHLVSSGCRVLSISVGSSYPTEPDEYERSETERFENMIRSLEAKGYDFLIFKAAGNDAEDAENYALNRIMTGGEHAKKHVMIVGSAESGLSILDRDESWSGETEKVFNLAYYSNFGDMIDICAPGSDILSTIPHNDYVSMSGTSMATPMAAGVAGLVYGANPDLNCEEVRNILLCTARYHVVHEFEVYPLVNAKRAVELALKKENVPPYEEPELGFVTGLVQDARTLDVIENAAVRAVNRETGVIYEASVMSGVYTFCLEPGVYNMEFSARGYITETVYKVQITAGSVQYNMLLNLIPKATEKGEAVGAVIDAFTGYSISYASVTVYRGMNNTTGTPVTTTATDSSGYYHLELDPGNYTILCSADDYMDGWANIIVVSGETRYDQDCTLTPVLNDGEVRVVLTWGSDPRDLDLHMVANDYDEYDELEMLFHVYWYNKDVSESGNAALDVDDTTGYGPETVSIYVQIEGASYYFYVHDYTNRKSDSSHALALSGAQVKVYIAGQAEPIVFNVPNMDGNLWHVFYIENGEVHVLNFMTNCESPAEVGTV